jgi:DNA-binding transcriptional MerR regulator
VLLHSLYEQVDHRRALDGEPDVVDAAAVTGRPGLAGQAIEVAADGLEGEKVIGARRPHERDAGSGPGVLEAEGSSVEGHRSIEVRDEEVDVVDAPGSGLPIAHPPTLRLELQFKSRSRIVAAEMLDIGEVAEATGLAPSALRFYERRGLLSSPARNGLRRTYEPDVIYRLGLIVAARDVGFSLGEIGELLDANDELTLRALLAAKVTELDERIDHLVAMRDRLSHGVSCRSPSLLGCPRFKRSVRAALPAGRR